MATTPKELSIAEIRSYMLNNDSKVTNHALVKHFKHFLTKPETQNEARKLFKVYVNILATIKNENNQKYLILRKKYINELPPDDVVQRAVAAAGAELMPSSPGGISIISESSVISPMRPPPPYIPPPPPSEVTTSLPPTNEDYNRLEQQIAQVETVKTNKVTQALFAEPPKLDVENKKQIEEEKGVLEVEKRLKAISKEDQQENKENTPRFSLTSSDSLTTVGSKTSKETIDSDVDPPPGSNVSVKEAARKFNRLVSEEEAKAAVVSPSGKKKIDEKNEKSKEEKPIPEVTLAHIKAKEWIVAMARASYQDLSKLANDYPELVKLHDPYTGYTALHWAAKHGNQDVVKLIAGTYKADVNARTNGGYTPLHISMQFGRADVFELLVNVYKANRDLVDWSGNKPLDYSKQSTSVSASTFSKIKAKKKPAGEKDLGFLRIGSLNVRVKKTTEAFSNFLGVGNGLTHSHPATANRHHQRSHRHHLQGHRHHPQDGTTMMRNPKMKTKQLGIEIMSNSKSSGGSSSSKRQHIGSRASVPVNMNSLTRKFENLHKSWGSVDNIQNHKNDDNDKVIMPPPKNIDMNVNKRPKSIITTTPTTRSSVASSLTIDSPRGSISSSNSSTNFTGGYSSMPTTPNQTRTPIGRVASDMLMDSDSDSACGFDSSWSMSGRTSVSSGNLQVPNS